MHKRCLQIIYSHNTKSFEELLETDNSVAVLLANESYKIVNWISIEIMKDIFPLNDTMAYNTRNKRNFYWRTLKWVNFGSETLFHLASKIWHLT